MGTQSLAAFHKSNYSAALLCSADCFTEPNYFSKKRVKLNCVKASPSASAVPAEKTDESEEDEGRKSDEDMKETVDKKEATGSLLSLVVHNRRI